MPPPSQPPPPSTTSLSSSSQREQSDVQVGSKPTKTLSSAIIDAESINSLSRPGSTTSMGSRHESELMEQLRKVEESAAKDKWRNIVHFCKEVSTYLHYFKVDQPWI